MVTYLIIHLALSIILFSGIIWATNKQELDYNRVVIFALLWPFTLLTNLLISVIAFFILLSFFSDNPTLATDDDVITDILTKTVVQIEIPVAIFSALILFLIYWSAFYVA